MSSQQTVYQGGRLGSPGLLFQTVLTCWHAADLWLEYTFFWNCLNREGFVLPVATHSLLATASQTYPWEYAASRLASL